MVFGHMYSDDHGSDRRMREEFVSAVGLIRFMYIKTDEITEAIVESFHTGLL